MSGRLNFDRKLGAAGHPELAIYTGQVLLYSTDRNMESVRDLAIRVAVRGQHGDSLLSVAELGKQPYIDSVTWFPLVEINFAKRGL